MNVSLIIPMSNADHALDKSLASLAEQKWPGEREIIIVDNGFTARTRDIITRYLSSPKIIVNKIKGLAGSYNQGILAARYEYIILMHHDIILP